MSPDEVALLSAIFVLVEMALTPLFAPMLRAYQQRGELATGLALMGITGFMIALLLEHAVAALIVVAVLQP